MRTYQSSPRGQAPPVTWRQWLLPLSAAAGIVALLALSPGAPSGPPLSYSQFLNDVGAGAVRAVTIDPAGQVTGSLVTGQPFTTTIPVALGDRTLAGQLAAHHVQVTATAAGPQTWSFAGLGAPRGYSEHTQWLIDREVTALLTRAEARARELLTEHIQALHQLISALVERETITGDQVRALVRAASPPSASADRPDPYALA